MRIAFHWSRVSRNLIKESCPLFVLFPRGDTEWKERNQVGYKKKKKTIDARWPARRSGLSIPLGNTSSGEINHRLRYRERMKEERKRRETNQTKRQRKGSLLFVERKEKESSREGRIERRRIRENSWGRGKIWKNYEQRRHESGYNKIKEEEEEIRRGYPEREERYASWTSLL